MKGKQQVSAELGQSNVELMLLLAFMAIAVVGMLHILGFRVGDVYCRVVSGFNVDSTICPGEGVLFVDDFTDGMNKWQIDRGNNWRIETNEEDDEIELCAGPGGEHRIFALQSEGSNYTVSFDGTLKSGPGYGVYFYANDARVNGVTFQYDRGYGTPGAFIFRKWINGIEMSPFRPWVAAEAGYPWYDVKRRVVVTVRDNVYTTTIDGRVVATAVDTAQPPEPIFEGGRVGLRTWSNSVACFDNIRITIP